MKVIVYSTSSCGICHSLMQWLETKEISYNNILVDSSDEAMESLVAVSDGAIGTPFTVIEKEDGEEIKIAGFNQKKFELALGL